MFKPVEICKKNIHSFVGFESRDISVIGATCKVRSGRDYIGVCYLFQKVKIVYIILGLHESKTIEYFCVIIVSLL